MPASRRRARSSRRSRCSSSAGPPVGQVSLPQVVASHQFSPGGCVAPRRNKKVPTAGKARSPSAPPVQRAARAFLAPVWPLFHPPSPYSAQNAVFRPISAPVDNSKRRKDLFFGIIFLCFGNHLQTSSSRRTRTEAARPRPTSVRSTCREQSYERRFVLVCGPSLGVDPHGVSRDEPRRVHSLRGGQERRRTWRMAYARIHPAYFRAAMWLARRLDCAKASAPQERQNIVSGRVLRDGCAQPCRLGIRHLRNDVRRLVFAACPVGRFR